ncbi:MAG: hypothetical protein Q4F83_10295 [Eubacteriales bacterium]|nr:hypothetical protein [Eubacteriales bacterium]
MTSAEFTDEELNIIQELLKNHLDEGIELVGTADEETEIIPGTKQREKASLK